MKTNSEGQSTTGAPLPAEPPKAPVAKAKTAYVVLRAEGDSATWEQFAAVDALSSDAAIKEAAAGEEGEYVAVPARSWQPKTLKKKVTETFDLT